MSPNRTGQADAANWRMPTTAGVAGIAVLAGYIVLARLSSEDGWVPILDSANLALHEAGHPLMGLFSQRLTVYGGTLFQLLFPALVAWHFLRRDEAAGLAVGLVWLGENLLNVARYMADARARVLPLVGGGEHDWTEIFSRWGVLAADTRIAGLTAFLGWALILATLAWLGRVWLRSAGDAP
ncbi:MAG TPA: hypothetical protein PKH69_00970 [Thiobacillaceae bacterium]|nr:hypothetical protein [Thiobacillaceae bacterium]HNU63313.1 hypothetical protein [Thiobacillaceae bacterium]